MTITSIPHLNAPVPGLDKLFIAGEWVEPAGSGVYDVISPSTEEVVVRVPDPSPADADRAVAAARRAFDEGPWPRMTLDERIAIVTRLCDAMEARMDEMNRAWAVESGPTLAHGEMINTGAGRIIWRSALEFVKEIAFEERRQSATGTVQIIREPVGTVLGILTYNGPIVLMGMKIIPALLAGCPVIIKPAPESQLTTRILSECIAAADFPTGVISVLAAGRDTSDYLVGHDGVDMVGLTGGTAIGVQVLKRVADRMGRVALELGGKSPAIILDDADLDQVLPTLVVGGIGYCGQVCVALTRVFASRNRYDEVVARMAESISSYKLGDPFDPTTDLGPLAVERARDRCEYYVGRAQEEGAKVVVGGRRPPSLPKGWYYEPTLLSNVTNDMQVAQEEIFGPVVSVIPYEDVDDAIRLANDSKFGLAASVYSSDGDAALAVARRIRSGSVAINLAGVCLTEPFGGYKQSGIGRECGREGVLEFTQMKTILLSGSYLDS